MMDFSKLLQTWQVKIISLYRVVYMKQLSCQKRHGWMNRCYRKWFIVSIGKKFQQMKFCRIIRFGMREK